MTLPSGRGLVLARLALSALGAAFVAWSFQPVGLWWLSWLGVAMLLIALLGRPSWRVTIAMAVIWVHHGDDRVAVDLRVRRRHAVCGTVRDAGPHANPGHFAGPFHPRSLASVAGARSRCGCVDPGRRGAPGSLALRRVPVVADRLGPAGRPARRRRRPRRSGPRRILRCVGRCRNRVGRRQAMGDRRGADPGAVGHRRRGAAGDRRRRRHRAHRGGAGQRAAWAWSSTRSAARCRTTPTPRANWRRGCATATSRGRIWYVAENSSDVSPFTDAEAAWTDAARDIKALIIVGTFTYDDGAEQHDPGPRPGPSTASATRRSTSSPSARPCRSAICCGTSRRWSTAPAT